MSLLAEVAMITVEDRRIAAMNPASNQVSNLILLDSTSAIIATLFRPRTNVVILGNSLRTYRLSWLAQ